MTTNVGSTAAWTNRRSSRSASARHGETSVPPGVAARRSIMAGASRRPDVPRIGRHTLHDARDALAIGGLAEPLAEADVRHLVHRVLRELGGDRLLTARDVGI